MEALLKFPYRTTLQSDQGFQYQHWSWGKELKKHHIFQSMSRKELVLITQKYKVSSISLSVKQRTLRITIPLKRLLKQLKNRSITTTIIVLGGKNPVQYRTLITQQVA